jgi:hypothetical protein
MSSKSGIIGISERNQPTEIMESATENVVGNVIFFCFVYKPNVYDSCLGQSSRRRLAYVHIWGVYFPGVKIKIFTSLNIYHES